jgi:hypothetical protein
VRKEIKTELKLGKGVLFVKSQIRRLPQTDDEWQAGFQTGPKLHSLGFEWLGVVVSITDTFLLADEFLASAPNVNDLARLLANAMRRPQIERPHRPGTIHLQATPQWTQLIHHLKQLGIEVRLQPVLEMVQKEVSDFCAHLDRERAPPPGEASDGGR